MCRWVAYRGETTAFEHYVTEPEHSLITQSLSALQATSGTNGDGFGLGWYGAHAEPGLYRETRPAWSDENLRYLCRHLQSHLFFAHVRAATGTAVTRQNCHPFACGRWMFMHNGFIGSWSRLRRKVEAMIPDPIFPSRAGTTDSEAIFLAMVGADLDRDPVGATRQVLRSVCRHLNEDGHRDKLRFTAALANGQDLFAFRFAENDHANTLYVRQQGDQLILVSEPYDRKPDWEEVPTNHAVIALASKPVQIIPLFAPVTELAKQERLQNPRVNARAQ